MFLSIQTKKVVLPVIVSREETIWLEEDFTSKLISFY